ncbi:phage tail protein [Patescibacteria group bacterium]|nr:phage tail protein [Patescibacteria group bacterium]MBU1067872.1 phage tail protein [Patescibacteria group bacterium]
MNGADVLILVDGVAVGSQRGVTFDEMTAERDESSKDSRAKIVGSGRYSATVKLDALYVPDDASYLTLLDAMRTGTLVTISRQDDGVETEEAAALITSISESFPDQDTATVSISLTISGFWAAVS